MKCSYQKVRGGLSVSCNNDTHGFSIFCKDHLCLLGSSKRLREDILDGSVPPNVFSGVKCRNLKLEWSLFCSRCLCPHKGCNKQAYVCENLCKRCHLNHFSKYTLEGQTNVVASSSATCNECQCVVCGFGPKQRQDPITKIMSWGDDDKLLCWNHKKCLFDGCVFDIAFDALRYCSLHRPIVLENILTLGLCLKKIGFCKNVRGLILKSYQKTIER